MQGTSIQNFLYQLKFPTKFFFTVDEADVGYQNCGLIDGMYSGNWLATFPREMSPLALGQAHTESTCNLSTPKWKQPSPAGHILAAY